MFPWYLYLQFPKEISNLSHSTVFLNYPAGLNCPVGSQGWPQFNSFIPQIFISGLLWARPVLGSMNSLVSGLLQLTGWVETETSQTGDSNAYNSSTIKGAKVKDPL